MRFPRIPRRASLLLAGPLAAAVTAALPAPARAGGPGTVGVGVQAGPICADRPVQPGTTRSMGNLYVENTGSAAEAIAVTISPPGQPPKLHPPLSSYDRHSIPVPASWVSARYPSFLLVFPRHSVTVQPGHSALIPVTLAVPADARHAQYRSSLNARTVTAAPAPGTGAHATAGAGGAVEIKFSVGAPPPSCTPDYESPSWSGPWWAVAQRHGSRPPAGWSFGGPADQQTIWTYIPPAGGIPADRPASVPPGWNPRAQMQVWTTGANDFVRSHKPGWRYLPGYGPFGVSTFEPASGKLPSWALKFAAGDPDAIPGTFGAGATPAPPGGGPASSQGSQPDSYYYGNVPSAASILTPGNALAAAAVLAAAAAFWWRLRRRGRGRP